METTMPKGRNPLGFYIQYIGLALMGAGLILMLIRKAPSIYVDVTTACFLYSLDKLEVPD